MSTIILCPHGVRRNTGVGQYIENLYRLLDRVEHPVCFNYENRFMALFYAVFLPIRFYNKNIVLPSEAFLFFAIISRNVILVIHDQRILRKNPMLITLINKFKINLRIIVPTKVVEEEITNCIENSRVRIIPNLFTKPNVKSKIRCLEKPKLGYVGSFEDRKNVLFLINLCEAAGYELVICTTSFLFSKCSAELKKLMNNVTVVTDADLSTCFSCFDIYITLSNFEGFGRTLIDAQLHRVPVICSDIPPHREIMGGTGFFIDLAQPDVCELRRYVTLILSEYDGIVASGLENASRFLFDVYDIASEGENWSKM